MDKKRLIIVCLGVLVIAAVASAGFFYYQNNRNDNSNSSTNSTNSNTKEAYLGVVTLSGEVTRQSGSGSCGIAPWNKDCSTYKVWWGVDLVARDAEYVLIIPDGEDRWVVTNLSDVVKDYPQYAGVFSSTANGYYETTTLDFGSLSSDCDGTISGARFPVQISGVRVYDGLKLVLSSQAKETLSGACGTTSFNYETSHWNYGIAAALSGDPEDMTAILGPEDYHFNSEAGVGTYSHAYTADTNPSPQNRDHVVANVSFACYSKTPDGALETKCPWDK